jgi:hypothetical protein
MSECLLTPPTLNHFQEHQKKNLQNAKKTNEHRLRDNIKMFLIEFGSECVSSVNYVQMVINGNKKFWEEIIPYFPYTSHLFEVLEPNLIELNLSELTVTSFNSIYLNLTEFTAVNNLVAMVTIKHKQ